MAEVPLNMLTKLLVFVRAPEFREEVMADGTTIRIPEPTDDFMWCYADNVSSYAHGWRLLRDAGCIDLKPAPSEVTADDDGLHINLAAPHQMVVRFTQTGLDHALEANCPEQTRFDVAARDNSEKAQAALARNNEREGFGQF